MVHIPELPRKPKKIASQKRERRGTGGKWFGIEHWGVEPDMMTFAKGLANGLPIGATIATQDVADRFRALSISTFGGNPVSTRAALATLNYILNSMIC